MSPVRCQSLIPRGDQRWNKPDDERFDEPGHIMFQLFVTDLHYHRLLAHGHRPLFINGFLTGIPSTAKNLDIACRA